MKQIKQMQRLWLEYLEKAEVHNIAAGECDRIMVPHHNQQYYYWRGRAETMREVIDLFE